ncbi:hypothetical protein BC2230_40458 [Burkholderia cepacia]
MLDPLDPDSRKALSSKGFIRVYAGPCLNHWTLCPVRRSRAQKNIFYKPSFFRSEIVNFRSEITRHVVNSVYGN